jgi:hypothetical protein
MKEQELRLLTQYMVHKVVAKNCLPGQCAVNFYLIVMYAYRDATRQARGRKDLMQFPADAIVNRSQAKIGE